MRPLDTSPEARALQLAIYRAMAPAERLKLALDLSDEVRLLALAGIAHRHPDLSPAERTEKLVELLRKG